MRLVAEVAGAVVLLAVGAYLVAVSVFHALEAVDS